jgi:hypothetical protein
MEKEFIPYEETLALKELGFDEECLIRDTEQGEDCAVYYIHPNGRPTFSQTFRWFRDKGLNFSIDSQTLGENGNHKDYFFSIDKMGEYLHHPYGLNDVDTYEEAELACLRKLIEIIKK